MCASNSPSTHQEAIFGQEPLPDLLVRLVFLEVLKGSTDGTHNLIEVMLDQYLICLLQRAQPRNADIPRRTPDPFHWLLSEAQREATSCG